MFSLAIRAPPFQLQALLLLLGPRKHTRDLALRNNLILSAGLPAVIIAGRGSPFIRPDPSVPIEKLIGGCCRQHKRRVHLQVEGGGAGEARRQRDQRPGAHHRRTEHHVQDVDDQQVNRGFQAGCGPRRVKPEGSVGVGYSLWRMR